MMPLTMSVANKLRFSGKKDISLKFLFTFFFLFLFFIYLFFYYYYFLNFILFNFTILYWFC